MTSAYWLFRFTSYSYCQGTRDSFRNDMRLLKFTLPCDEMEAKVCLITKLKQDRIEFDIASLQCLTELITNS